MGIINDNLLVRVFGTWNDCRGAEVPLKYLLDIHWRQPDGAPHPLVHGYISCEQVVNGTIPHDCDGGSRPHRLRVCVLKRHTLLSVHTQLSHAADSRRDVLHPIAKAS